jgi:hypothetical protein
VDAGGVYIGRILGGEVRVTVGMEIAVITMAGIGVVATGDIITENSG